MSIRFSSPACVVLFALAAWTGTARGAPPAPAEIRDAEIAMGFDPRGRCPELTHADTQDRSAALVLFLVGPTGVPSRLSVSSSSGSPSLDQAAVDCVRKLRFLPAVHSGDGNAIDSWQEIAWKWGRFHTEAAPVAAAAPAAAAAASMPAAAIVPAAAGGRGAPAEVRACFDGAGRLAQEPVITRPSGSSGLDAAALSAARSMQPGNHAAECLRISVTPEGPSHDGGS